MIFPSIINGCRCRFASIRVACIPTKILDSSTGCGPRQSHIHRQSRIPSIHRKTRTSPSENQIRKIQGEFEAPPSFTLQGRADCPRACINQYSEKHTKRVENTRTSSQGLSRNDRWESKNRKTSCNRRRHAVVDDNYCHHHRLVAQEDCTCERTTSSPLRGDSCNLLKATPGTSTTGVWHNFPQLGQSLSSVRERLFLCISRRFRGRGRSLHDGPAIIRRLPGYSGLVNIPDCILKRVF